MSTTTSTTTDRPAVATATAVALVLSALLDFAHIGAYMSGADIPAGVLVLKVVFGITALVAVVGLLGRQRWAIPLALVVTVPNLLLNAWGFVESLSASGSTTEKVVTGLGVLLSLTVIALAVPLARRPAVV